MLSNGKSKATVVKMIDEYWNSDRGTATIHDLIELVRSGDAVESDFHEIGGIDLWDEVYQSMQPKAEKRIHRVGRPLNASPVNLYLEAGPPTTRIQPLHGTIEEVLSGDRQWSIHHGDCIEHMATMPERCIDFSVFSPPFPSLYAYTSQTEDIGNSEDLRGEAKLHLSFFYRQLARIVKPGRVILVHVAQIPRMKRAGEVGLCDFRGMNIRLAERAGLVFEYDWVVRKNPQSQAIRTKSRELQFSGLESDRAKQRGCLPDYLLKFRVPGENAVRINSKNEVSRNDWIKWAESCWDDIAETDTLNTSEGKGENDTKHICPLQLEVIRRAVILFTNPGEIVFSPFTGIGSEGFVSVGGRSPKTGRSLVNQRRFYGCELKQEYLEAARKNLAKAVKQFTQPDQASFQFDEAEA